MVKRPDDPLQYCYSPDGGLVSMGWYLAWRPENETATLDGEFTAADLEAIAKHMREKSRWSKR